MKFDDIMRMAVNDVIKVDKLRSEVGGGLSLEGFRSRARSVPGLVLDAGLLPAYTFVLSKSDLSASLLNKLMKYFIDNETFDEKEKQELKKELGGGEGAGYGTIATLMTIRINHILGNKELGEDLLKLAVNTIETLSENPMKRVMTEKYMLLYLEELKKLVDAYYKAKWKGEG